jgi:hypothetical protein
MRQMVTMIMTGDDGVAVAMIIVGRVLSQVPVGLELFAVTAPDADGN